MDYGGHPLFYVVSLIKNGINIAMQAPSMIVTPAEDTYRRTGSIKGAVIQSSGILLVAVRHIIRGSG